VHPILDQLDQAPAERPSDGPSRHTLLLEVVDQCKNLLDTVHLT
jgi:hypothetical protein